MLNDKDRNWLERSIGKQASLAQAIVFLTSVGMVAVTAFHLFLAVRWGSLQGHSLADLLQGWVAGVQTDQQYSGIYLNAMDQLDVAFLELGVALVAGIVAATMPITRRRNQNIVETLKRHGAW